MRAAHPGAEEKYVFHDALQAMQKTLVLDLIKTTRANVAACGVASLDDVRAMRAAAGGVFGRG